MSFTFSKVDGIAVQVLVAMSSATKRRLMQPWSLLVIWAMSPLPTLAGWVLGDEGQSCDTVCAMHGGCESGGWPKTKSAFLNVTSELNFTCAKVQDGSGSYDPSVSSSSGDCGWKSSEEGCGWSGKVYYPCDNQADMLMRCGVEPPQGTRRFCPCQHVERQPDSSPTAGPTANATGATPAPTAQQLDTTSPTVEPAALDGVKSVVGSLGLHLNDPTLVSGALASTDDIKRGETALRRTLADMTGLTEDMVQITNIKAVNDSRREGNSTQANIEVSFKIKADETEGASALSIIQSIDVADVVTFASTLNDRFTAVGLNGAIAEVITRDAEASNAPFDGKNSVNQAESTPSPPAPGEAEAATPVPPEEADGAMSAPSNVSKEEYESPEGTGPTFPPAPSAGQASSVAVSMLVHNVNFNELAADASMLYAFEISVKKAVVKSVKGHSIDAISEDDVEVMLSEGSVQVQASIKCADESYASEVESQLNSDAELKSNVFKQVSAVPGIDDVTTGAVEISSVSALRVPSLTTDSPDAETPAPAPVEKCGWDAKVCRDGTAISRNPAASCEFPACPPAWQSGVEGHCPGAEFHNDFSGELDGHEVYQDIYIKAGSSQCTGAVLGRKKVPDGSVALNATLIVSEQGCDSQGVKCPMLEVALYPTEATEIDYKGEPIPTAYRWCFGGAGGGSSDHCDATVVVEVGIWYSYVFNFQGFAQKYPMYVGHELTLDIGYRGGNPGNTTSKAAFRNDVMEWHGDAWNFFFDGGLLRSKGAKGLCVVPERGGADDREDVLARNVVLAPCGNSSTWTLLDGPDHSKLIALQANTSNCIGVEDGIAFNGAPLLMRPCREAAAEVGQGDRWLIYADQVRSYEQPDFFMAAASNDLAAGVALQVWGARKAPFRFLNEQMVGLLAPETSYDLREQSCDNFVTYRLFGSADWNVFPCGPWGAPCIPAKARCNGIQNCMNGYDEAGCAAGGAPGDRGQKIFGGPHPVPVRDVVSARCGWDSQVCSDGTGLSRNPETSCTFPSCPPAWTSSLDEPEAHNGTKVSTCGQQVDADFVGFINTPEGAVEGDHDLLVKQYLCKKDPLKLSNETWVRKEVPVGSYALNASFVIAEQCPECNGPTVSIMPITEAGAPEHVYRWCFNARHHHFDCDKEVDLEVGQWYNYLFNFKAFFAKHRETLGQQLVFEIAYSRQNEGVVSTIWRTNSKRNQLDARWVWNADHSPVIKSAFEPSKCLQVLGGDGMMKDMAPLAIWPCDKSQNTFRWNISTSQAPQKIKLAANPTLCIGHRDQTLLGQVRGGSQALLVNCDKAPEWVYDDGQIRLAKTLQYYLVTKSFSFLDGTVLEVQPAATSSFTFLNAQVRDVYEPDDSYQERPVSCAAYLQQLNVNWVVFRCDVADSCVPTKARCNGIRNCEDGVDEVGCTGVSGGDRGLKLYDGGVPPAGGSDDIIAVAALSPAQQTTTPLPSEQCDVDAKVCPDGTGISRNEAWGCPFPSCPESWQSNANNHGASQECKGSEFVPDFIGQLQTPRGTVEGHHDIRLTQGKCAENTTGSTWMKKEVPLSSVAVNMSFALSQDQACAGPVFSIYFTDETDQSFRWCFNDSDGADCDKHFVAESGLWYTYLLSFEGFRLKYPHHSGRSLTFAIAFPPCTSAKQSSLILRTNPLDGHYDDHKLWSNDGELIRFTKDLEMCLSVAGAVQPSFVEGREVILWQCRESDPEFRWEGIAGPKTGSVVIRSKGNSDFCLAHRAGKVSNSVPLMVTTCGDSTKPNLLWRWDGSTISSWYNPGYDVVTVDNQVTPGAKVVLWSFGTAPFRFLNMQAYMLVQPDAWLADPPGKCADIERNWAPESQYKSWTVFRCSAEDCLTQRARCNGIQNCAGGVDEVGCQPLGGGDRGELSLTSFDSTGSVVTTRRLADVAAASRAMFV